MGRHTEAKLWTIREQVVADPVSGLTFEFTVNGDGEPILNLYGNCLVFGNRTIVFEDGSDRVHGETTIPGRRRGGRSEAIELEEVNLEEMPRRSNLNAPR